MIFEKKEIEEKLIEEEIMNEKKDDIVNLMNDYSIDLEILKIIPL